MKKIKSFIFTVLMGTSVFTIGSVSAYCSETVEVNTISETNVQDEIADDQENQESESDSETYHTDIQTRKSTPPRGDGGH